MPTRGIGESWLAAHLETYIAPNHSYLAHDFIRFAAVTVDWHIVSQFGHALVSQEPCDQNVRVGKIHLTHPGIRELGSNLEAPALLIVEKSGKDGWRVEVRVAQKIDRAVHTNERDRLHVPNHPVVFDWFKRHRQLLHLDNR